MWSMIAGGVLLCIAYIVCREWGMIKGLWSAETEEYQADIKAKQLDTTATVTLKHQENKDQN